MCRLVCKDKRPAREGRTRVEDASTNPDHIFEAVPENAIVEHESKIEHDSKSRDQCKRPGFQGGLIGTVSRLIQPRHDKAL